MREPMTIAVCGSDWEISVYTRNGGTIEVDMKNVCSASYNEAWPFPLLTPEEARELARRLNAAAEEVDYK